jgi:hypothetical protein
LNAKHFWSSDIFIKFSKLYFTPAEWDNETPLKKPHPKQKRLFIASFLAVSRNKGGGIPSAYAPADEVDENSRKAREGNNSFLTEQEKMYY